MPNDFEVGQPDWHMNRRFWQVINKTEDFSRQAFLDSALAVEAPWNEVAHRSGLVQEY
jgi:hypothetical protein